MEYVKIPQNVRVEDKLIGPLSLRQIILIAIGGGFSYALFAVINKSVGSVGVLAHAVIWWPAIFSTAFAVIRINDISLFRYCLLILETLSKPRRRVWQPRQGIIINIQTRPSKKSQESDMLDLAKMSSAKEDHDAVKLEDLRSLLDHESENDKIAHKISLDDLHQNVDTLQKTSS